jgi:Family of unknown function (DUF6176)
VSVPAQCVKIPIINGKTQRFVDWMAEVNGRQGEMLASMRIEGVRAEAMFLERSGSGDALIFYMQADDLARAQQVFASSTLAIDALTRAIITECWDTSRARPLEVLLELVGPAY